MHIINLWICFYTGPGYPPDNYDNREMGYGGVRYPPSSYSMHQVCMPHSYKFDMPFTG